MKMLHTTFSLFVLSSMISTMVQAGGMIGTTDYQSLRNYKSINNNDDYNIYKYSKNNININSNNIENNNDGDNSWLTITPSEPQTKYLSSNLMLTCTVPKLENKKGMPHLHWWNPRNRTVDEGFGNVRIERPDVYTVRLYISKIGTTEAGMYKCSVTWSDVTAEKYLHVYVVDDIIFDESERSMYEVRIGENVLLSCKAQAHLPPSISWSFNGTNIDKNAKSSKYSVKRNNGLLVRRVSKKDAGMYKCSATIEPLGAFRTKNIELKVLYAPQKVEITSLNIPIQGSTLLLACQANGNPPIKYEWLKEQKITDILKTKTPILKNSSTLQTVNISKGDEGRYFCRATNALGMSEAFIDIKPFSKPVIKPLMTQYTILEGAPLIINCESEGLPTPAVRWLKQNNFNKNSESAVENYETAKLIIPKIDKSHNGTYVCVAASMVGNASAAIQLIVESIPSIECAPPFLHTWTNQTAIFNCIARGDPLPSVHWSRAGHHVGSSKTFTVTNFKNADSVESKLKILMPANSPWIYGTYSFVAKNIHGSQSNVVKLIQADLPIPPHNFTIFYKNSTHVTIRLMENLLNIKFWKLNYQSAEGNETSLVLFENRGNLKDLIISKLRPNTMYMMLLSAGNELGFGEPVKFLVETDGCLNNETEAQSLYNNKFEGFKINREILITLIIFFILTFSILIVITCVQIRRRKKRNLLICCRNLKSVDFAPSYVDKHCYSWYKATDKTDQSSNQINDKVTNNLSGETLKSQNCNNFLSNDGNKSKNTAYKGSEYKIDDDNTNNLQMANFYWRNQNHTFRSLPSPKILHSNSTHDRLTNNDLFATNHLALNYNSLVSTHEFDESSGVYEEIPKSVDSTAVSEILDEYHSEDNMDV